MSKISSQD
jgi:hypothetical protein